MKVLTIGLLVLMLCSLTTGICYGETPKNYLDKGIYSGVGGDFERAQQQFRKALEADPFYMSARLCLKLSEDVLKQRIEVETALCLFKGVYHANRGMFDEAIAEYKRALEINPNYAGARNCLGEAYRNKGMLDEAIAEYKKALKINPNCADVRNCLGETYRDKGMLDEAIAECKKAIEIDPNDADVHNNLGSIYLMKEMYDEAIVEYNQATEIDPNDADLHTALGALYHMKGVSVES